MEAFKTAERVIISLYEQLREHPILHYNPWGGGKNANNALHIVFDAYAVELGYRRGEHSSKEFRHPEWENRVHAFLHFIITAKHRVYFAESQEVRVDKVDPKSWTNTSNHDSCWRSDGLDPLSQWYFWACDFVQQNVPEDQRIAPKDVIVSIGTGGIFGQAFQFVRVERGEYLTDNHYQDTLLSVNPIKFKIVEEE